MIPETTPLPNYPDAELASRSASELVRLLLQDEDRVPRNLIDECARRGDEMAQSLGELLHKDYYWGDDQTDGEWWLLHHAVMILGLIPTERAGALLIDFMRRIEDAEDVGLQDLLVESWPVLFLNKPDPIVQQLRKLAQDRENEAFLRIQAVAAAVAAASRPGSPWPLDRALDWAAAMAFSRDEALPLRSLIGNMLLDFARPAHRRKLESLADVQSDESRLFGREDITRSYAIGGDAPEWERYADPWAFYSLEAREQRERDFADIDLAPGEDDDIAPVEETYVRPAPKVGRNDPCPCGSGKKYKKCCLAQES